MLDVLIVGAGPAGLAVAIAASEAGLEYEIVEKGVLVNSIYHFPRNMVFFTTAELLEIGGLPFVTPYEKPTQAEGLKYYRRVAERYDLRVAMDETVTAIRPEGEATSPMFTVDSVWKDEPRSRSARHVVVATGYYDHPNLLGVPGEDLPHVCHYYREPHAYYRRKVVVVGGKNSAAIVALELYRSGAAVTLVHRGAELGASVKYWIRPDIDNRIKEGAIAARFLARVVEIRPAAVLVDGAQGPGGDRCGGRLPADRIPSRLRPPGGGGGPGGRGDARARARPPDARDQRARPLPGGSRSCPAARPGGSSSRTAASTDRPSSNRYGRGVRPEGSAPAVRRGRAPGLRPRA
jgi:thioredoxin reductase (NADPH)